MEKKMRPIETKWEIFLQGFYYIFIALEAYNAGHELGYEEFWETLSKGWYSEYIYPYDDLYSLAISEARKTLLAQEPKIIYLSAKDYDRLKEIIENEPEASPGLIELMNRKTPFDT
jgi:hypothetical protein